MLVGSRRVSSDNDRQTTDVQRETLLAAGVDARQLFADKASGARDDRPGLAEALNYVRPGDCLVVWTLDRLGRSLSHLLTIVTTLRARGVALKSLTEQMDTTTPHGELLFYVFGALAQYERALTTERIMAGLAAAKKRGTRGGRPLALRAGTLQAIREVVHNGASKAAVCRTFRVQRSTLYDALARATPEPRPCTPLGKMPAEISNSRPQVGRAWALTCARPEERAQASCLLMRSHCAFPRPLPRIRMSTN